MYELHEYMRAQQQQMNTQMANTKKSHENEMPRNRDTNCKIQKLKTHKMMTRVFRHTATHNRHDRGGGAEGTAVYGHEKFNNSKRNK